jgi:serpin B
MGISLAFSPDADFSLISKKDLYIDQVIHKAVLDISEEGTEAAAVSAVVMRTTSVNKTNFIADHPFIVIIKEKDTGNLLFMGAIVNPNFGVK